MTPFSEQLSAASTKQLSTQLDAQLRFFSTVSSQVLDNASRLVSLNLSASRDTVERSSRTVRELIGASQPRDLLVLRTHAEEQMRSLFDYGRELFNIGANAQPFGLRTIQQAAPAAPSPAPAMAAPVPVPVEPVAERAAPEPEPEPEPIPAPEPAISEPFIVQQEDPIASADDVHATSPDAPAPVVKQRQIARAAAGKNASKAAAVPQPLAAPVEDKDVASVTRINTPKRRK